MQPKSDNTNPNASKKWSLYTIAVLTILIIASTIFYAISLKNNNDDLIFCLNQYDSLSNDCYIEEEPTNETEDSGDIQENKNEKTPEEYDLTPNLPTETEEKMLNIIVSKLSSDIKKDTIVIFLSREIVSYGEESRWIISYRINDELTVVSIFDENDNSNTVVKEWPSYVDIYTTDLLSSNTIIIYTEIPMGGGCSGTEAEINECLERMYQADKNMCQTAAVGIYTYNITTQELLYLDNSENCKTYE